MATALLPATGGALRLVFPSELGWMALDWCAGDGAGQIMALQFGHASPAAAIARLEEALVERGRPEPCIPTAATAPQEVRGPESRGLPAAPRRLLQQLQRYAAGEPVDFSEWNTGEDDLTPFARRVVIRCRQIPFGETLSYQELAAAVGSPRAARAVGNVMRTNRVPLVVPCHRVVGAGGGLGGYSAPGGLVTKRRLLALETGVAATAAG